MLQVLENRELSWLKFNGRVLEEAARDAVPLCERLSFLSIFQSNLDEFFMVRVGALCDQMEIDPKARENKTDMTAKEQLGAIFEAVRDLQRRKEEVYHALISQLEEQQIHLVDFRSLNKKQSQSLEEYFHRKVALLLSPTIVGKRQPFPFLKNMEIYAVAVLQKKGSKSGARKLGIISCGTNVLPRLIPVPEEQGAYMLLEELVLHCINKVFKGYRVESKSLIRVTRSAEMDADALYHEQDGLYQEHEDYREFMAKLLKKRRRQIPVRMEMSRELGVDVINVLCKHLKVKPSTVFRYTTPLDLSYFSAFQDLLREHTELFYPHRIPQKSTQFDVHRPILEQIQEGDKLLSYPYDSVMPFLRMLQEAAVDEDVLSIKMTLYRVAKQSQVVEALIEAAENGKEVQVLVELKARFDEENNIQWSRRLEQAGCHVIYGIDGYKVHSKVCLITRKCGEQLQSITQIGTGNYNEKTARIYTDYMLFTASPEIGEDAAALFRALSCGEVPAESRALLIAPNCMQNRILDQIDAEICKATAGKPAYVGAKLNALTDKVIIEKLIEASKAGVQVDLIVRGICCLLPGVAGQTEQIRVRSIVGRFLEHSRVYLFGTEQSQTIYLSSADWMTRNMRHRVEVAVPVLDAGIQKQIRQMFTMMLQDNRQAWQLQSDGRYERALCEGEPVNAQELFCDLAYQKSKENRGEQP